MFDNFARLRIEGQPPTTLAKGQIAGSETHVCDAVVYEYVGRMTTPPGTRIRSTSANVALPSLRKVVEHKSSLDMDSDSGATLAHAMSTRR